jgi:beta-lactamase regulating signal transducer with metallopeptidase domain
MTIESYVSAIVWLHVWQIAVLSVVVGTVNHVLGRRWPHVAYGLWLVVLAKCFVPPIAGGPVDFWRSLPPISTSIEVGWVEAASAPRNAIQVASLDTSPRQSASQQTASSAVTTQQVSPLDAVPRFTLRRIADAVPMVWLLGSALLFGMAIGRSSEVGRRLRRTSAPVSNALLLSVQSASEQIGLARVPRVMQTSSEMGPLVAGILRPTVYLPAFLVESALPAQREAMLLHELAHVRRRDTWVAGLQFIAQIIWWFHPLVWWMNRELSRHRERCCDEEVVANLAGRRADYARLLVNVLEAKHRLEPLWGYPAVRPVELTRRRLEEIMKRKNMVHARAPWWCWVIVVASAAAVLPGANAAAVQDDDSTDNAARVAQATTGKGNRAAAGKRPPALLSYGDGKADGKKSYGGSGHMIRFELPDGVTSVRGLRIHGSRYGLPQAPDEDFEITFLSDDRQETLDTQAAPYRLFKRGKESWVRVLFDEEVELPQKFWVAINFNPHQTKGVYLSYDTSTKGEYSRVGLPGDDAEPKETAFGGDWMVQVMLPRPAGSQPR